MKVEKNLQIPHAVYNFVQKIKCLHKSLEFRFLIEYKIPRLNIYL